MSEDDYNEDEVIEETVVEEDEEEVEEEEEGEDLFGDNFLKDYEELHNQDGYDPEILDDEEYYEPLTAEAKAAAEMTMMQRDKKELNLDEEEEMEDIEEVEEKEVPKQYNEVFAQLLQETISKPDDDAVKEEKKLDYEDEEDEDGDDFKEYKGRLAEWLALEKPRRWVKQKYYKFLTEFSDKHYIQKIEKMVSENKQSLEITYMHLAAYEAVIMMYLVDEPGEMLKIFDEVTSDVVMKYYPDYIGVAPEIRARIEGLPVLDSLRDLRQSHLNYFIKVGGVVTRRTAVYPQMNVVKFDCAKCGSVIGPIVMNSDANTIPKPGSCTECQSKGPFNINQSQTVFKNYQKITLQESPGTVPAGRIPRSKDVILLHDLIDTVRPGEEIQVTGIYKHSYDVGLNTKQGFPVFATVIYANHIHKVADKLSAFALSEEDKKKIRALSNEPQLLTKIIRSIAPSIYGHEDIKLAIALSLFGGQHKDVHGGKHRIRGDINVLMVGDPGTAKSQFLKYVEKTAHRAVYTTGKGSTAVGLTAAVRKDPITREWTLEGGALVLADNGVCLIDEFDKMNDQDRTSIHEAMEQQSISISKAGIVTTLQARCPIIAAANPTKGKYDPSKTFQENVDLSDPILSRFDILCVVKDIVDADADEMLANFVVDSHTRSHPLTRSSIPGTGAVLVPAASQFSQASQNSETSLQHQLQGDIIPQDLLKKYILFAKTRYRPKVTSIDESKLSQFYVELRSVSHMGGSYPVSVRHLESAIRMSEACARIHLRDFVRDDDLNVAIGVLLNSFISAQKQSVAKILQKRLKKYQFNPQDYFQVIAFALEELMQQIGATQDALEPSGIRLEDLKKKVKVFKIYSVEAFLSSEMFKNKYVYDSESQVISKK